MYFLFLTYFPSIKTVASKFCSQFSQEENETKQLGLKNSFVINVVAFSIGVSGIHLHAILLWLDFEYRDFSIVWSFILTLFSWYQLGVKIQE